VVLVRFFGQIRIGFSLSERLLWMRLIFGGDEFISGCDFEIPEFLNVDVKVNGLIYLIDRLLSIIIALTSLVDLVTFK
jgi:hypothetical protein